MIRLVGSHNKILCCGGGISDAVFGQTGVAFIMNSVMKLISRDVDSIPFQEASLDIWDKKYRLSSQDGEALDATMDDTYQRVARALADVESEPLR